MILEAIVTTTNDDQTANIAPMGPDVEGTEFDAFVLRPFRTSKTYRNLVRHGQGVLHVVDDVELLARAAIDAFGSLPPMQRATGVDGWTLDGVCRWYEFRVNHIDDQTERAEIAVGVVGRARVRDFFGLNRAKHAVVEAAILATRIDFLGVKEVSSEIERLWIPVRKTGGEQELRAMTMLDAHVQSAHDTRDGSHIA